jgi:hypothetical protein
MSLSAGVFPSAFKTALIHPVYKGGGKARNDPGSYRPVAILCALSKVLETMAKEDLEAHMKEHNILHVAARLPKGEVLHYRACDSSRRLGHGAGERKGGGRGRL